jgi:hypothetical protein
MASAERIEALRAKHAALERKLEDTLHRPLPDYDEISRLKREKLKLKDEMVRLSHI